LQEDGDTKLLSSAQLETLVYSNMRFNGPRLPGSGEHSSSSSSSSSFETGGLAKQQLFWSTRNHRHWSMKSNTCDTAAVAEVCHCIISVCCCCTGARAGFFLGDGAGVGKGRQIAALIKEYWLRRPVGTRRVLWVSTSADLRCGLWWLQQDLFAPELFGSLTAVLLLFLLCTVLCTVHFAWMAAGTADAFCCSWLHG
jgi:hypothetical protein